MDDPQKCKACGADLEVDAGPEGLCPRCLLKLALPEGRPDEATETELPPEGSAQVIGPYRLLQKVGEGGMGEVWEAEQKEPVRRKVALKLIKAGMDTKQVVARFESERQALAMMDHPSIAKVFDAGATDAGRPYFVMEYVSGLPVTEYCDTERLNTKERLELFMQVCEGVQHAHQKGIIHRDIKPSNVLVQLQDGKPVPKIIDFGVAKATQQRLTEKTLFTQLGVLVGTPAYMSPEQAELTGLDVDTRTDVYSLGVLLYELLVGALPFDPRELREAGFDEIRRVIREEEPSKPSTRLSTLSGEESSASAKRRQTDLKALTRDLRGDLDWITMRALEKNRARRYGSPSDLAEDIRRHLGLEPVKAGPPSATYRAGRFIRRHRLGVSAASLVVLALVIGLGAATWGLIEARRANAEARQQAQTAEQVSEFLVDLFEVSDPSEARGNTITAREVLDKGAERIERELADQPHIQTRLLQTIGRVYTNLGLYDPAETLLDSAIENVSAYDGAHSLAALSAVDSLAWLETKRGRYDDAEARYREVLEQRRRALGDVHPDTLATMNALGMVLQILGRYEEADSLLAGALAGRRTALGEDHENTLATMVHLGKLRVRQGRFEEARPLLLEAIDRLRAGLGEDHPMTLSAIQQMGWLCIKQGQYEEAARWQQAVREHRLRIFGVDHPDTLIATSVLANVYRIQGRDDEAESLFLEVLAAPPEVWGSENHREIGIARTNLGVLYTEQGRYEEAEAILREARRGLRTNLGDDHPLTLTATRCLAVACDHLGRQGEAQRLLVQVYDIQKRVLGESHTDTLQTLHQLGESYLRQGRYEEAEAALARAVELRREVLGEGHPRTAQSMAAMDAARQSKGAPPEKVVSDLK